MISRSKNSKTKKRRPSEYFLLFLSPSFNIIYLWCNRYITLVSLLEAIFRRQSPQVRRISLLDTVYIQIYTTWKHSPPILILSRTYRSNFTLLTYHHTIPPPLYVTVQVLLDLDLMHMHTPHEFFSSFRLGILNWGDKINSVFKVRMLYQLT